LTFLVFCSINYREKVKKTVLTGLIYYLKGDNKSLFWILFCLSLISVIITSRQIGYCAIGPASLTVESTPSGADIYLDFIPTGKTTPYTFDDLVAYSYSTPSYHYWHLVSVRKDGYPKSGYQSFPLYEATEQNISFDFASAPTGSLTVTSNPDGAEIYLDFIPTGQVTPYTFDDLVAYSYYTPSHYWHLVTVRKDDYPKPGYQYAGIYEATSENIFFDFDSAATATELLTVESTPSGADIYLDFIPTGQVTPYTFTDLAAYAYGGSYHYHTVIVRKDGYFKPGCESLSLIESEPKIITFNLTAIPVEPTNPALNIDLTSLNFGEIPPGTTKTLTFTISNTGGETLSGTITDDKDWIDVSPASFGSNSTEVSVTVNTTNLTPGAEYTGTVSITSNGGNATVSVSVMPTCVIVYPNPFSLSSGKPLNFWGSGVPNCEIKIYTLSGSLVKTIKETEGKDRTTWDGTNESGERIVRGIYLYTTSNPREKNVGRFTVVR